MGCVKVRGDKEGEESRSCEVRYIVRGRNEGKKGGEEMRGREKEFKRGE